MAEIPDYMIAAALARYREEQERALKTLADIEDGMTFHEAHGSERMRDVTSKRRTDEEAQVVELAALIEAYEKLRGADPQTGG